MSLLDRSVSKESVIPTIESRIFNDRYPRAQFAVGVLAVGDQVLEGRDDEFLGYLRLRANVYANRTNMISKDLVLPDGTERDGNDSRSTHIGIIENLGDLQRVVGAMRLIVKDSVDLRPLPIEEFFTETFKDNPAPIGSTEASRFIAQHEDPVLQDSLRWPLYTAGLSQIMARNLGPTYAVIEESLERELRMNGFPFKTIAPPKFVPEYNYDNLGGVVDTDRLAKIMERRSPGALDTLKQARDDFVYFGTLPELEHGEAA